MPDTRRAMVAIIQRGDPEIAGALMDGMIAGKAKAVGDSLSHGCAATAPSGREPFGDDAQGVESVEIVTVEADKWRRVARQVRVAVGNDKTAEDYRLMIVKARCEYAVHRHTGPAHTVARKLLLAWVMLCQGIRRAYRMQDRVLR